MTAKTGWLSVSIVVIATLTLLPFASKLPDGLERVAETLNFSEREQLLHRAPLHNYALPQLSGYEGEALAAFLGILLVAGIAFLLGKVLARGRG